MAPPGVFGDCTRQTPPQIRSQVQGRLVQIANRKSARHKCAQMLNSYPWYITDWLTSETRRRLTLPQRAVYRDLLDICYLEGSLPSDRELLARSLEADGNQLRHCWEAVLGLFELRDGRYFHKKVDEVRSKAIANQIVRSKAGKESGRSRREKKSNICSSTTTSSSTFVSSSANAASPNEQTATLSGWPEMAAAVRESFPATDDGFIVRLQNEVCQAAAGIDKAVTDHLAADAVRECRKQANGRQNSAGLFLRTVPQCVKTWLMQPALALSGKPKIVRYTGPEPWWKGDEEDKVG